MVNKNARGRIIAIHPESQWYNKPEQWHQDEGVFIVGDILCKPTDSVRLADPVYGTQYLRGTFTNERNGRRGFLLAVQLEEVPPLPWPAPSPPLDYSTNPYIVRVGQTYTGHTTTLIEEIFGDDNLA